ncbi:50S ribosomal protein L11 methyltransferase [Kozakia baliensis]|uniref:class I SAM-dependent methyltransferase n=1 Tax=Kozakia baliensis TaxID=153496 RepID=UPI00345C30C5
MKDSVHFITSQTVKTQPPLTPEITLYLATEITPIWQATEAHLAEANIEPPFWAFAWPGSQLLARFALDHPDRIKGRRVLDFACGGGLAALAACRAGANHVVANDIDDMALAATRLNAELNGLSVETRSGDLIGSLPDCDLLLCGDVCYNQQMADRIVPWLRRCASTMEVWMADPGRPYAPKTDIERLAQYAVPTSRELEDRTERQTSLYRILPA